MMFSFFYYFFKLPTTAPLGTEDLYTKVFNQVANRYGKEFTWEHKIKTMGMQTDEAARTIIGLLELPMSIDEFKAETEAAYKRIFPEETEPLPGDYFEAISLKSVSLNYFHRYRRYLRQNL